MATTISHVTNHPVRLRRPAQSRLLRSDVGVVVVGVPLTALLLWLAGGGLEFITSSFSGALTGIGQLAGLAAGLAALGGLALAARPASVERKFGMDRMLGWHRWTGMVAAFGLLLHAVALIWAYSLRASRDPLSTVVFLFGEPWFPAAMVGGALMALVAFTSYRRIRNRMAYETWYYLHILGYAAVALALGHVLVAGSDFSDNLLARLWWIALYLAVAILIVWSRLRPLALSMMRPLRITEISRPAPDSISVWVGGRSLRNCCGAPGQYYQVRFGTRDLWWQTHPYSVSAAPFVQGLRFTFRNTGDDAAAFERLSVGTRVWLEGPYGTFTAAKASGAPVLLIAGGSGVAPLRAILEDLDPTQRPEVIVRVSRRQDAWFYQELEQLVTALHGRLHLVFGSRLTLAGYDPFAPASLRALVPDLAHRAGFVSGPTGMTRAAMKGLAAAGMPKANIHTERYDY
ncbi:MAG: FAD-binding FR-type protein [Actinomycetota bacterium]|nr:FAD-binding FR-type protein [Actinomycetota bacterium]